MPGRVVDAMRTLTYRQLLLSLERMSEDLDDEALDMPVVLRVCDDEGQTHLGGLIAVDVDPGCTEEDALVLDGDTQADGMPEDDQEVEA